VSSPGRLGPRLVVAGTHSGVGKTTVATGIMAALRRAGHAVAGAKAGPDFIDPGYHALACGRPPRNLDPWLCGAGAMVPLAARAAAGADVLVVEGVMGLFDGAADGTPSSTAEVAKTLEAPVVLVVDAASMSASVAALVHGYATYDPTVRLAAVVLNRVGSDRHEVQLREALEPLGVPVLGALRRDDRLSWRDRHLGLVPVVEAPEEVGSALATLAEAVTEGIDLAGAMAIARSAPTRPADPVRLPPPPVAEGTGPVVAVAGGPAFSFTYTDTIEALEAAGARVVGFDPAVDEHLPEGADGIMVGGGFPEVHVARLAANHVLLAEVRRQLAGGLVTWAECGGLMWLCRSLDGRPLVGAVPAEARMTGRMSLGYRRGRLRAESPLGPAGTSLTGHEFHYSKVDPPGDGLELSSRWGTHLDGFAGPSLVATYLHHHPGGDPSAVAAFVAACARHRAGTAVHR